MADARRELQVRVDSSHREVLDDFREQREGANTVFRVMCVAALSSVVLAGTALADQGVPLDQLTLKGTHNSYECSLSCTFGFCHNDCSLMHHQPMVQIDDFGVYAVELDFSIENENGAPRAIVGHDGHCGDGCWTDDDWGKYLEVYFASLHSTRAFKYRPIIIYIEKKCGWGDDVYDNPFRWMPFVEQLAVATFGRDHVYAFDDWRNADKRVWPPVPALAQHVILIPVESCATKIYGGHGVMFPVGALEEVANGGCQSAAEFHELAAAGPRVLRTDHYQYDWTFDDALAPPNPVCVKARAAPRQTLSNLEDPYCGGSCVVGVTRDSPDCDLVFGELVPEKFTVGQHGTFRLPYRSVRAAAGTAAKGGGGWTLLIGEGSYREAMRITSPMVLRAETGTAVIGR